MTSFNADHGANFRQDINALRAWAVLSVVAYHFKIPGFISGFTGVDIFFAISGFLITGRILSQLDRHEFSLTAFWLARLRRIFPALFVVLVFSLAVEWFITFPGEYVKHVREALSSVALISNLAFSGERGYFDAAAQTKPLLHTWSLSLECQFYLSLPLVFWFVWRFSSVSRRVSNAFGILTLILCLSFVWCLWRCQLNSGEGFFSLRARAWEFLLGATVAFLRLKPRSITEGARTTQNFLGALGWMLVIGSTFFPLALLGSWPGLPTLMPVFGASLILYSRSGTFGSGIIKWIPVQRLGDWSYSIYLWHWPLWVFLLQWNTNQETATTVSQTLALLSITIFLGYVSYRYVEMPTRYSVGIWRNKRLATGYVACFALTTAFAIAVIATHGFPERFPPYQQRAELARLTNSPRDECFRDGSSNKRASEEYCTFGAPENLADANVFLWGDSHADQYLEPINDAASRLGLHGLIATQSGCRAFLDSPNADHNVPESCNAFNREVHNSITSAQKPSIVILGRNWVGAGMASAKEVAELSFSLLKTGQIVVLILPSINFGVNVTERWLHDQSRAGKAIDDWVIPESTTVFEKQLRTDIATATAPFAGNPRFITVDPVPVVCRDSSCYLVKNGQANFRDTAHISNVNAMQYEPIFAKALHEALRIHSAEIK